MNNLELRSPVFKDGDAILSKYTCDGKNINPPLEILGVPDSAKSLVLIVDDPDSPAKVWVHWLVWNISPDTKIIEENSVPIGATEGINDFFRTSYGGPCPQLGTHHYYFKLYALDAILELDSLATTKEKLEKAMEMHILDTSTLIGLYSKA